MTTRLMVLLALLLAGQPASAIASDGIVNLSWDDCGAAGQQDKTFACDTNSGTHTLIGSFSMFVALDSMVGNDVTIELQTAEPAVPGWWQLKTYIDGTPACRNVSGVFSADFTGGPYTCHDTWFGQAGAFFGLGRDIAAPNRQRIFGACVLAASEANPLPALLETYSFRFTINNTKTTGSGSCGGCSSPMTLVLTSLIAGQPYPDLPSYKAETVGTYALWNPAPVPTRKTTWGAIKSLYR